MEAQDEQGPRQRKSQRVSIFVNEPSKADEESSTKQSDSNKAPMKKRSSSRMSVGKASKGFSQPVRKKKRTSIEFISRDSDPLESRINQPSLLSKTWKFLTEDIIDPVGISAEESYIYHVRSFAIHFLHAILVLWVIYGTFDLESNYQSIIVSDMISKSYFESSFVVKTIQFKDIRAPEQIWDFIRGVILKIIYPETYNNTHSIWEDNVFVGVPRLFQVRVKNGSCTSAPLFSDLYQSCYGYFNYENAEDTKPFGPNSSAPWRYSENPHNILSRGHFYDFTGSGYAMDFSKDYNSTLNVLNELENDQWIRLGTRAVLLDFAMYCPDTNTFLITKITMEILPWGAVLPSLYIYNIKLLSSFNGAQAFLLLGLQIILLGYTIGLNYIVCLRLKRNGMKTFFTFNNLINLMILTATYITLGVHIALKYYTDRKLEALDSAMQGGKSEHPTFGNLMFISEMCLMTAAIILICMGFKFIRYAMYFNKTAKLLIYAIKKVKGELIWFTIMSVCIQFGCAILYCAIYGILYPEAMSPLVCLGSMIFSHVKAYLARPYDETRTLPFPINILILAYVPLPAIYVNCISLQTYVALMVHGWDLAATDISEEARRIKANEYALSRITQILEKLKLFNWANKLQERHIVQMNEDDYCAFTEIMRRYGWSRLEIRLLLRKYGIRKGDDLTIDELFEVYQDFWSRNALFLEVEGHAALQHDLEYSQRIIKHGESTIADLKVSIERLADQFLDKQPKHKPPREPDSSDSIAPTSRRSIISRRFWQ